MKFKIFSVSIGNDYGENDCKNNSKNDLTFTEHMFIFMQI